MDGPVSDASVIALRCRTSDRTPGGVRGVDALAPRLARLLGVEARLIGSPGDPRAANWDDDLRDSRGCLLEAGGQVDDALTAGDFPVLLASDCSICMTTLPTVLRQLDMPLFDALDYLRGQLTLALSTEDIVEGVTAFFEKREPEWTGR